MVLQFRIFLLLFTSEVLLHKISLTKTAKLNHANHQSGFQIEEIRGNSKKAVEIGTVAAKTESETFGSKSTSGRNVLTPEGCFGGIGHWLCLNLIRKKCPKKGKLCCCQCHREQNRIKTIGNQQQHGLDWKEVCLHDNLKECEKWDIEGLRSAKQGSTDAAVGEFRPWSSRSSSNVPTKARSEYVPKSNLDDIVGIVQQHNGQDMKPQRTRTYRSERPADRTVDDCCCVMCYRNCFEPATLCLFGVPIAGLAKGCSWCCWKLCRSCDDCC